MKNYKIEIDKFLKSKGIERRGLAKNIYGGKYLTYSLDGIQVRSISGANYKDVWSQLLAKYMYGEL